MPCRIAINGFGRIGRLVLRAWLESPRENLSIVAVNDGSSRASPSAREACHMLVYDSLHGILNVPCAAKGDDLLHAAGQDIVFLRSRAWQELDWKKWDVDIVLECSGAYRTRERASLHLERGAKKVLISAPAQDPDASIVVGVNDATLRADHRIVSALSCTTNCLAPLACVLDGLGEIERGFALTCHAYTADQPLHDKYHTDLRRARAAALSIVPTSTGAASALALVLPRLKGKILGSALRVPTAAVSALVFDCILNKPCSVELINETLRKHAEGDMKGILAVCDEPLVSTDFLHRSESTICDLLETRALDANAIQLTAWYDNEWGFAQRMLDLASMMAEAKATPQRAGAD